MSDFDDDPNDDGDVVEQELNYRPPHRDTRFFKTNPAGYNIVIALGAFFALSGWVLTVMVMQFFVDLRGLASAFVFFVALIVGLGMGFTLPNLIWRGIGPLGRRILRPIGIFGAFPVLILCFLLFSMFAGVLRIVLPVNPAATKTPAQGAPAQAATSEPVVWEGKDWKVLLDAKGKPRDEYRNDARAACAAVGRGWRLPTASDTIFVRQRMTMQNMRMCMFHAEGPILTPRRFTFDEMPFFRYYNDPGWFVDFTDARSRMKVLCIRP